MKKTNFEKQENKNEQTYVLFFTGEYLTNLLPMMIFRFLVGIKNKTLNIPEKFDGEFANMSTKYFNFC